MAPFRGLPPEAAALADYVPPEEILVAIGRPGHGLDGFRRSHAEALEAARVAALAGGAAAAVTRYERVELVSLLASDFPRARAFVAARLGPLAAATEPAARLRETVLAFLAANGRARGRPRSVYVHHDTVAYRVQRAEELLGRGVTDEPVELTCALTLAAVLGSAVLTVARTACLWARHKPRTELRPHDPAAAVARQGVPHRRRRPHGS